MNTKTSAPDTQIPPPATPEVVGPSWRAFAVGIPLLIGVCLLSVYADMVTMSIQMGVMQLAPPAVAALLVLALVNQLTHRLYKKQFLSRFDLLTIYSMLLVGVLVATRGVVEKLVPPLAYLPYFATRENNLNEQLTQHLPAWAVPFLPSKEAGPPPEVIANYWNGSSAVPWSAWLGPLLAWAALLACVMWVFVCLAALLRRQWMDNEQLTFPLTTLPLALINNEADGKPFLSNPTMWMGFSVAFGLFLLNGLNANNGDWPFITVQVNLGAYFTEKPWNSMQGSTVFLSLAAIGFAYFLPKDLLFSLWLFFGLTRMTDLGLALTGVVPTGMGTHGTNVLQGYQAAGAYLVLIVAHIKLGWPYFKAAWRTAFGPSQNRPLDDSEELLPYRTAYLGLIFGFLGIVLWLWIAGMNPLLAAAQMGIFIFVIVYIMSRATNEAGLLGTETSFLPSHLINLVYPLPGFGATSLTMLGLTDVVFARDLRGTLLSTFMDSQKMARSGGMKLRTLLLPIVLSIVISFVVATAYFLYLHYTYGGTALYPYPKWNSANMFNRAAAAMNGNAPPRDWIAYGGLISGGIITLILVALRARFSWFPLNPLGFALAPAGTMNVFWFPFFVAWLLKSNILRFGGIDAYRKLSPFMLGLILGEFMAGSFWALGRIALGWNVPQLPWP